jgi:hypothetical protein
VESKNQKSKMEARRVAPARERQSPDWRHAIR